MAEHPLIDIRSLGRDFTQRQGIWGSQSVVRAVRDVTLAIARGETLGIVGESGCGKSTLGRMAVGLLTPSSGDVFIDGAPLYDRKAHTRYKAFRRGLAGRVQMIFQDPYSSLNPRMRIGESVAEPWICAPYSAALKSEKTPRERVAEILRLVGMDPDTAGRYPHEFSGGQRQRVAIARALITRPAFVVCDEPTSSLDASVQSQVLNLLQDMQEDLGLTYMFISHDLAVVRHMSDRVAVLYRGFLVEEGDAGSLFSAPLHPYTRLLLASVPALRAGAGEAEQVFFGDNDRGPETRASFSENAHAAAQRGKADESGQAACPFAPRCPEVMPVCEKRLPPLLERGARRVRCFLYEGNRQ